jgi:Cu/Ag efflux protein CusF
MKKLQITTFLILSITASVVAQSRAVKWQRTIDGLEKSEFIQAFTKAKSSIEKQMTDFNGKKATLKAEDVEEVKKGYEASMVKFDKLLDDLKKDFLDKEARIIMTRSPDRFTKYYNSELEEAVRFYNNQCLSKADALVNASQGAFGLAEIQLILGLGKEVFDLINQYKDNMTKMSSEYFENHLIKNLRLKKWDQY